MTSSISAAAAKARDWRLLLGALLAYSLVFGIFSPPLSGIEDESGFVNQAFVWSKGALSAEGAGFARFPDFIQAPGGEQVSWRNPGRSLTLLPLVASQEPQWLFATGAVIHVATSLVAAAVLVMSGASPLWAILVLCHPTLALYSRTITADELGGLFLLGAVAVALMPRARAWGAGLLLGLAVVTRSHAAIVVPFVLLAMLHHRGWRAALAAGLAVTACCAVLILYNLGLYGSLLAPSGNTVAGQVPVMFSLDNVWTHLPFYATALLLLWPLQLLALGVDVGPVRTYACAIGIPVLGLLLCYFYRDAGGGFAQELVVGQRLLQVALPVWIVCYALALRKVLLRVGARWPRLPGYGGAGALAASVALLGAQVILFQRHQDHLLRLAEAKAQIVANVPRGALLHANQTLHKLFWSYPDCAQFRWREIGSTRAEVSCAAGGAADGEYVAFLAKWPGEDLPPEVRALTSGPGASRLPTDGELVLFRVGS